MVRGVSDWTDDPHETRHGWDAQLLVQGNFSVDVSFNVWVWDMAEGYGVVIVNTVCRQVRRERGK